MEQPYARRLTWEACFNARDLGGYPTDDGGHTRWRSILRADNLRRLTANGVATVIGDGVRTVIDLRSPFELRLDPCPFGPPRTPAGGPAYHAMPMLSQEDETLDEALHACASVAEMYTLILECCPRQFAAIFACVAAAPDGGVLVHCHAGKDRTGLVVALAVALAGVPGATIAADYALSDLYLEPLYEDQLGRVADPAERAQLSEQLRSPLNAAAPESMLETLAYVEAMYGGVHGYLRQSGLAERDLQLVAARLRG